jgi:hypothetical protein
MRSVSHRPASGRAVTNQQPGCRPCAGSSHHSRNLQTKKKCRKNLQGRTHGYPPVLSSSLMVSKKAVKARRPCAASLTAHICSRHGRQSGKHAVMRTLQ